VSPGEVGKLGAPERDQTVTIHPNGVASAYGTVRQEPIVGVRCVRARWRSMRLGSRASDVAVKFACRITGLRTTPNGTMVSCLARRLHPYARPEERADKNGQ